MRLAILTQYYPPETGAPQNRLSDLAIRLARMGHHVQVLTALPNYPGHAIFPAYAGKANTVERIDGVTVARVGISPPRDVSMRERMRCYLSFARHVRRSGPGLLEPCDVVLMESPPLSIGLAGVRLARRLGARLVTNISDLWPQSAADLGMIKSRPVLWSARQLESWIYRRSAAITGQTNGIVADIARRHPGKRVELFPNGVDLSRYATPLDRDGARAEYGWASNHFVIGYTGTIGHAQAPEQILEAVKLLADLPDLRVAFFGDGPRRADIERRIKCDRLDRVAVHGTRPSDEMPRIQSGFDAGIVPLARGRVLEGARPSKLFEIMAAGLPVLLCARGEAERLVRDASGGARGFAVPPEDPAALAAAIRRLCADPRAALEIGRRGRAFVTEHFDRQQIAEAMARLLVSVAAEPHTS